MRRREWLSASAALAAVATAVFALGGATRWSQAIVALCLAAGLVPTLWSRGTFARRPPLLVFLGVLTAISAMQLLPLPGDVLAVLQPIGHGLRIDGAEIAGTGSWPAVTLDVPATLNQLCLAIILCGLAIIALRIAATERGRYLLLASLALICGTVGVIVGIHELLGAETLYGLYAPEEARPSILGPLLNENHLGCLMGMGSLLAAGLAAYHRQSTRWRVAWIAIAVTCAATAVASHSRGATLALLGGAFVTGTIMLAQRTFRDSSGMPRTAWRNSLPIAVVAASAIIVIIYASAGGAAKDLGRTSWAEIDSPASKFAIWRSSWTLVTESPWVGIGRGAFEPVFTRVHPAAAFHSFSHVENEYLQAVVELGVPACALLAVAAAWLAITAIRRWRQGPLVAGILGALALVAMQSVVDFGIELLGLAAPLTVIVAAGTHAPLRECSGCTLRAVRARSVAVIALIVVASVLLLSDATRRVPEDHSWLKRQVRPSLAQLREVIARHPLDYYPYGLAAQVLMAERQPDAVRFLNHALRLHPTHPALHHLAARMLYRVGQFDQATIEYGLALLWSDERSKLLGEIVSRFKTVEAAKAIPASETDVNVIMSSLVKLERPEVGNEWLKRVLHARPHDIDACSWLFRLALHGGDTTSAELATEFCDSAAPSYADRVALARFLLTHDRAALALHVVRDVERWPTRVDIKKGGWLAACDAHVMQHEWQEAKRCLRYLDVTGFAERSEITKRLEAIDAALRAESPK